MLSYILLSVMLAVVKSADNGTINELVLHARCSLYPNIHPLVLLNPHRASVSIPERGTSFFFMLDLCHTCPFAFNNELSTDTMAGSTNPSFMKSTPIAPILDLMSIDTALTFCRMFFYLATYQDHMPSLPSCCMACLSNSIHAKHCCLVFLSIL